MKRRIIEKLGTALAIFVLATSALATKIEVSQINNFNGAVEALIATSGVPASRIVAAGLGLTGGGDLSADRSFAIDYTHAGTWTGAQTFSGGLTGALTGPATSASVLTTPRTLSYTGDVTGGPTSFDGSANITTPLSLDAVGTAGTYGAATQVPVLTTDSKGRVTGVTLQTITGVPASTAVSLATPRLIGTATGDVTSAGSSFDGTANNANAYTLAGTIAGAHTFSGAITGSAGFVGNLTGNASGSSGSTTGNAATATALATSRTIAILTGDVTSPGGSFTGAANETAATTLATVGAGGTCGDATHTSVITFNVKGLTTACTATVITGVPASTAVTLATPRLIGTQTGDVTSAGSNFDGSAANTNATTLASNQTAAHTWMGGNTFSGGLTITTVNPVISQVVATDKTIRFQTSGSERWEISVVGGTEPGSNVGSDLIIKRYDDTGASLGTALSVVRATGVVSAPSGFASPNANTFANTGSNFVIGGSTSATRSVTYNNFGQPTYLYSDNSAGATLGTLNNFSISGSGQGASIGTFNFGTGGVSGGQAGLIRILTTDTWATAANRSSLFQLDLIYQNSIISKAIAYDPAAGFWVGNHQVMPAMPVTMGGSTYATDADYAPVLAALAAIVNLTGTITANRTFTLPACQTGQNFRIVRTGAGAFTWTIGSKTIAQNQWIDEYCESSTFIETAFGSL